MSDTLTQLIAKVQASLGDDGTYFTTAIVTAAARKALREMNEKYPVNAGTLIDAVTDQHEYTLSDVDFTNLIDVLGVWLNDTDGDQDIALDYDSYFEDNAPAIRLRVAQSADELLLVRFTTPQTINGLDSETESTLPAWLDPLLVDGITYHALLIRGVARVEKINLQKDVTANYAAMRETVKEAWYNGLAKLAARRLPVSQPNTAAWPLHYEQFDR